MFCGKFMAQKILFLLEETQTIVHETCKMARCVNYTVLLSSVWLLICLVLCTVRI